MFENEKNKLLSIKRELNDVEFNLNNTEKNLQILENNINEYKNKNLGFNELNDKLEDDINLAGEVIEHQKDKNIILDDKINIKEYELSELKRKINCQSYANKKQFEIYKDDKYEQIENAYERQKNKKEKEKYFIQVIYSLYIIQKYFINSKKFNKKLMESDKEYLSINNNYNIFENYEINKNINKYEDQKINTEL